MTNRDQHMITLPSPVMPSPAIRRVLEVPELLDTIFRFLDDSSNASNARVCKKWLDVALDILWRHVDDLYTLFNILAPLRITGNEYVHNIPAPHRPPLINRLTGV